MDHLTCRGTWVFFSGQNIFYFLEVAQQIIFFANCKLKISGQVDLDLINILTSVLFALNAGVF